MHAGPAKSENAPAAACARLRPCLASRAHAPGRRKQNFGGRQQAPPPLRATNNRGETCHVYPQLELRRRTLRPLARGGSHLSARRWHRPDLVRRLLGSQKPTPPPAPAATPELAPRRTLHL